MSKVIAKDSQSANSFPALIGTAASHHMFKERGVFIDYTNVSHRGGKLDLAGGNETLPILGYGLVYILGPDGHIFKFTNCLHIPDLTQSLICGTLILKEDFVTTKVGQYFKVSKNDTIIFIGKLLNDANLLPVTVRTPTQPIVAKAHHADALQLHRCLGHPNLQYMKTMLSKQSILGMGKLEDVYLTKPLDCNTCDLAKGHKIPHVSTRERSHCPLENIHLDLSGIIRTTAMCGCMYFILFTDDYSRYRNVAGLKIKSAEAVFEKIS